MYTSYDKATGELGGAVPVISGLSDGNMVEIVEGLSQGDTVYYMVVYNPYEYYYYGSDGDAWVETYEYASEGDAWVETYEYASEGDAA